MRFEPFNMHMVKTRWNLNVCIANRKKTTHIHIHTATPITPTHEKYICEHVHAEIWKFQKKHMNNTYKYIYYIWWNEYMNIYMHSMEYYSTQNQIEIKTWTLRNSCECISVWSAEWTENMSSKYLITVCLELLSTCWDAEAHSSDSTVEIQLQRSHLKLSSYE